MQMNHKNSDNIVLYLKHKFDFSYCYRSLVNSIYKLKYYLQSNIDFVFGPWTYKPYVFWLVGT